MITDHPSILEYAGRFSTPETELLKRLTRETHWSQVYPQMLSGPLQGMLLTMFAAMIRPANILEIGTFTGYSAICLASGMEGAMTLPSEGSGAMGQASGARNQVDEQRAEQPVSRTGKVHTIEVNPELESIIRKYIRESGLEHRIILHIGDAIDIIPRLHETWDLVFIDADKPNYLNYYQLVMPRLRQGGFILVDNVLWDGKVTADPAGMDHDTLGIHRFNEFVQSDDRVENLLLPLRDGLMIIRKK